MKKILVIGYGQIGQQAAAGLLAAGHSVSLMTRSEKPGLDSRLQWIQGDALQRDEVQRAVAGHDVVFACFHASDYDSRIWSRTLPIMEANVLDAAAARGALVVFPESVYGFAAAARLLSDDVQPAPADPKGVIRTQLLEARRRHAATTLSVMAGDLIGPGAAAASSVIRFSITDRLAAGARPLLLAAPRVPHALTSIEDLSASMIWAAEHAAQVVEPSGHRLLIAPSSAPTLEEVSDWTCTCLGIEPRKPRVVPAWLTRTMGLFSRPVKEISRLAPIWRRPNELETSAELSQALGAPVPWQQSVAAMLESTTATVQAKAAAASRAA